MMTTPTKIRVRIALSVDGSGNWNAAGWDGPKLRGGDESERQDTAIEGLDSDNVTLYWIEAEVDAPTIPTIAAEVRGA